MLLQGGLTVRHKAHNLEIGGSIPPPARSFKDTSYRSLILSANPFSLPMTSTITIQFECLIFDKGLSKESINQQHTAGTFGRPVSSCEWIFSNVPFYFNLSPWIRLIYRDLQAENEVRHYWDI